MISPFHFASVINAYLPEPHASLLNGILLGIPVKTDRLFYDQLLRAGLLHLVVLSGSNIAILGNTVASLTHRFPKKISIVLTILCIIAFTLFVGPEPPIVRAACMGSLSLIALYYGKKNTSLVSLLVSIVLIAIFKPAWLSGVSLQLSAGATLGIILFGKRNVPVKPGVWENVKYAIIQDLRISLGASAFTVPLIFWRFRQISLIAPLANLAVSWIIAPLMVFGAITCLLGSININLGFATSYICYGLLHYMVAVIGICSDIPVSFFAF